MGRYYLTKVALLHCRNRGGVKTFDEWIPEKRALPLERRSPEYDTSDVPDVTQLLQKGRQLRAGALATREADGREAAERTARSFLEAAGGSRCAAAAGGAAAGGAAAGSRAPAAAGGG
jgi:hypothetical protein